MGLGKVLGDAVSNMQSQIIQPSEGTAFIMEECLEKTGSIKGLPGMFVKLGTDNTLFCSAITPFSASSLLLHRLRQAEKADDTFVKFCLTWGPSMSMDMPSLPLLRAAECAGARVACFIHVLQANHSFFGNPYSQPLSSLQR